RKEAELRIFCEMSRVGASKYIIDPDSHALAVVNDNALITLSQEYNGVYLRTFNLVTGFPTDSHKVSRSALDLIPPMDLERLEENRLRLSFYGRNCEKGTVVKFVFILRKSGWEIANEESFNEMRSVRMPLDMRCLFVHKFRHEELPSIVYANKGLMYRLVLDPGNAIHHPIRIYRTQLSHDGVLCAALFKGSDFVVIDNKLSKFSRRLGSDFTTPSEYHLNKISVSSQISHNRGKFYIAINRQDLYSVDEVHSRFVKIPLPNGKMMGAGLIFDMNDDLIVTDMKGLNPTAYRFPSRGIASLATLACQNVASMISETTLSDCKEVKTTDELIRVLFMKNA
ncbi:hypothetical protein PFISCL1PPCAC_5635, partial [Pristionchus fissidentatus]